MCQVDYGRVNCGWLLKSDEGAAGYRKRLRTSVFCALAYSNMSIPMGDARYAGPMAIFPPGSFPRRGKVEYTADRLRRIKRVIDLLENAGEDKVKEYIKASLNDSVLKNQYFREAVSVGQDGSILIVNNALLATLLYLYDPQRVEDGRGSTAAGYPEFIRAMMPLLREGEPSAADASEAAAQAMDADEPLTANGGNTSIDMTDVLSSSDPKTNPEDPTNKPVRSPPALFPGSTTGPPAIAPAPPGRREFRGGPDPKFAKSVPGPNQSPPSEEKERPEGPGARNDTRKRGQDELEEEGRPKSSVPALRALADKVTQEDLPAAMIFHDEAVGAKKDAVAALGDTEIQLATTMRKNGSDPIVRALQQKRAQRQERVVEATAAVAVAEKARRETSEVAVKANNAVARAEEGERQVQAESEIVEVARRDGQRLQDELDAARRQLQAKNAELEAVRREARRSTSTSDAVLQERTAELERVTYAATVAQQENIRELERRQRQESNRIRDMEAAAAARQRLHQEEMDRLRDVLEDARREVQYAIGARAPPPPASVAPTQQMADAVRARRKNMAAQSVNLVAEMRQLLYTEQQQLEAAGASAGPVSVLEAMERLGLEEKVDSLRKNFFYQMVANVEVEEFEYAKNLKRAWLFFEVEVASVLYWAARLQSDINTIILTLKATNKRGSLGIVESFIAQNPAIERPSGAGALFDDYQRIAKVNLATINKN